MGRESSGCQWLAILARRPQADAAIQRPRVRLLGCFATLAMTSAGDDGLLEKSEGDFLA
jgi:hypothetical protein